MLWFLLFVISGVSKSQTLSDLQQLTSSPGTRGGPWMYYQQLLTDAGCFQKSGSVCIMLNTIALNVLYVKVKVGGIQGVWGYGWRREVGGGWGGGTCDVIRYFGREAMFKWNDRMSLLVNYTCIMCFLHSLTILQPALSVFMCLRNHVGCL